MTRAEHISLATLPPLALIVVKLALRLAAWETRRRSRAGLTKLDAHMLRDIGMSETARTQECAKPFWRA